MDIKEEIENWKDKPKDLVLFLTENVQKDKTLFPQLIELLKTGSGPQKGTSAEVIKHVSKNKPEISSPYLSDIIVSINCKEPRVKWGLSEAVAYLSKCYPREVEAAIPNLLKNTKDSGTVVRWTAAFALTEIAENNPAARDDLVKKIGEIAELEQNNGVKNVYLKALKILSK